MNGPIAQMVALACHANAAVRGGRVQRFLETNFTCKHCDEVSFFEFRKSASGEPSEVAVAATPDGWFEHLSRAHVVGVRLIHRPEGRSGIPDRMTAGLVGGGGQWILATRTAASSDWWMSRWKFSRRDAPEHGAWRVQYGLVARSSEPAARDAEAAQVGASFRSALVDILAFSRAHDVDIFSEMFARALVALDGRGDGIEYHKDLCPAGMLEPVHQLLLEAAQDAWVFGGMGSWNDLTFEGEAARQYEAVSEALYIAVTAAICCAANGSDVRPSSG
jgi:hypothetical protein